jgi:HEAT repeat protein
MAVDMSFGRLRVLSPRVGGALVALGVAVAGSFSETAARAETAAVADKPLDADGKARFADIETELSSGQQQQVLTALTRMKAETHPSYVQLLKGLLERGANEPVLTAALGLAAQYAKPELSAAVAGYLQHRKERIRHAAAEALAKTGGPEAASALRLGLRSSDPVLREQCARALGGVADASALSDLFLALDRGIAAAAESIGRLCDDTTCSKLADRTGKVPFQAMSEALSNVVVRTDHGVSSNTKIEVIARVANLRTPQAAALLREIKAKWPSKGDPAVLHALDAAIDTFGGK